MVQHFEVTDRLRTRTNGKIDITHQTVTRYVREKLCPEPKRGGLGRGGGRTSDYTESADAFIYAAYSMIFGKPRYTIEGVRAIIEKLKADGPFKKPVFTARDGVISISEDAASGWGRDGAERQEYLGHFVAYFYKDTDDESIEGIYREAEEQAAAANAAIMDLWG